MNAVCWRSASYRLRGIAWFLGIELASPSWERAEGKRRTLQPASTSDVRQAVVLGRSLALLAERYTPCARHPTALRTAGPAL